MKLVVSYVLYVSNKEGIPIGIYSQGIEVPAVPDMDTIIHLFGRRFQIFEKRHNLDNAKMNLSFPYAVDSVSAFVLPQKEGEADTDTLIRELKAEQNGWHKIGEYWPPSEWEKIKSILQRKQ